MVAILGRAGQAIAMQRLAGVLAVLLLSGCRASVNAQAEVNSQASGQGEANLDGPMTTEADSRSALVGDPELDRPAVEPALLGARQGLRLTRTTPATCSCLSVALGEPKDAAFTWDTAPPTIDPSSQLVIALSSEGQECPGAPADSLGASYFGYEQRGADVVVWVETAKLGRPITSGAIIPKPDAQGRVLIRSVNQQSPYGRSNEGSRGDCPVWPSGPAR